MCSVMCNDRKMMVNFKPGEYTRKMFFFHSVTAQVKKNLRPLATGPDPLPRKIRPHTQPLIKYTLLHVTSVTIIVSCYR